MGRSRSRDRHGVEPVTGSITVQCPHCGAESVVLAGAANKRWLCDACGGLIDLAGEATATAPPSPAAEAAEPAKAHASRWMDGLTPEQQAAIRAEMAADPELLRNELARVRRETSAKVMGKGARSPLLRLMGAFLVLTGGFTAALPFAARFLGRLEEDLVPDAATGLLAVSPPLALLLGIGLMITGTALALGRRWGAHATAILAVFACFVFAFHAGVVAAALLIIVTLFLTRRSLE
jgi:ribosomal protein S27E/NADH:ubiquinone oxidoreductase subunit K